MLFQTAAFGLLLFATLLAFYFLPKKFRLAVLGVSSLLFYAASGLLDFALLMATLVIAYRLSLTVKPGGSRVPIILGLMLLLGTLGYFKYSDFAYENVNVLLSVFSLSPLPRFGADILPLGISFYTFQIVAYLIDLRNGKTEPERNFLRFQVFIMFFGQLIAGPIMRASEYLAQLRDLRGARLDDFRIGIILILTGLVKKVVIADFLAELVNSRFDQVGAMTQADAWVAAYLFAFQIFFDFSGYVSIALGLGRLFGIRLSENFKTPYLSAGPSEFWRRWHITLSEWFRDYLYIPLGGNRTGKARLALNLLLVMALAGLWHGAGWTFILWGVIHGGYLAVSRFIPRDRLRSFLPVPAKYQRNVYTTLSVLIFFHLTVLAWIPFRADDISTSLTMMSAALRFDGIEPWLGQSRILVIIAMMFGLHVVERLVTEHSLGKVWVSGYVPRFAKGVAYAATVLMIVVGSGATGQTFIYFRF